MVPNATYGNFNYNAEKTAKYRCHLAPLGPKGLKEEKFYTVK